MSRRGQYPKHKRNTPKLQHKAKFTKPSPEVITSIRRPLLDLSWIMNAQNAVINEFPEAISTSTNKKSGPGVTLLGQYELNYGYASKRTGVYPDILEQTFMAEFFFDIPDTRDDILNLQIGSLTLGGRGSNVLAFTVSGSATLHEEQAFINQLLQNRNLVKSNSGHHLTLGYLGEIIPLDEIKEVISPHVPTRIELGALIIKQRHVNDTRY